LFSIFYPYYFTTYFKYILYPSLIYFFISIFFICCSLLSIFPASSGHSSPRSKQHRRRYKYIYSLKNNRFLMNKIEIVNHEVVYGQIQYTYIYIIIYIEEPTTSLCVCLYLWGIYIYTNNLVII